MKMKNFIPTLVLAVGVALLAQTALAEQWTTANLPPGLISWWNADGNTLDAAGLNPASSSGQSYEAGRFGQAFHFNGVNQSVVAPGSDSLDRWTQFTLEAWVKLDQTADVPFAAPGRMVINRVGNPSDHVNYNQGYQFGFWDNARRITLNFNTNNQAWTSGFKTEAILPESLPTNVWLHVAATYDHNIAMLYLNGVPLKTNVIGAATVAHSTSSFRIGMDDNGNCPFPGSIDDVRVYNRAVSAAEIAALAGGPPGPVAFNDDFSTGVNTNMWTVGSTDPLYSMDASQGEIRISRLAGGTYSPQTMVLAFDREVWGDFDASVDFRNASINRLDGSPGNQVQLAASFGGQLLVVVRSDESGHGHNAHVFRQPPGAWTGEMATTSDNGSFRMTRVGVVVTAYYNGTILHSGSYNTDPVTALYFHLQSNGTRDAISVAFDNFHLQADRIVPKATVLQISGAPGDPFQLNLLNPTPGAWHWIEHTSGLSDTNGWSVRGRIVGGAFPTNWTEVLPLDTPAGFYRVRSQ